MTDKRAPILIGGAILAAWFFWLGRYTAPDRVISSVTWLYRSTDVTNSKRIFGINKDGQAEFGPGYDRETEVKKFVEMARQAMNGNPPPPRCYDATFSPREVIEVNPGRADPPPLITLQKTSGGWQ